MLKAKHGSKKGLKAKEHGGRASSAGGNGATKQVGKVGRPPNAATHEAAEECALSFPDLRIVDKNEQLPCYTSILSRAKDESVSMNDIDQLQLELETLLSNVAVRIRDLQSEITTLSSTEDRKGHLAISSKTSQKKAEEKASVGRPSKLLKDARVTTPVIPIKSKSKNYSDSEILTDTEAGQTETSKPLAPMNDTTTKFWAYVEQYCAEITTEDIKYLQELSDNCEKEVEVKKIPPLGKHYTIRWAEEDLAEERDASSAVNKPKRKPTDTVNSGASMGAGAELAAGKESKELLKKAEKICLKERIPGPLAQRLISALLEDNVNGVTPLQDSGNKLKVEKHSSNTEAENETPAKRPKLENGTTMDASSIDAKGGENAVPNYVKKLPHYHTSVCFERQVRKSLEVIGFLDPQAQAQDESDEISMEIKKCQEELRNCALHSMTQMKRVLKCAQAEVARGQVRKKLRQTDTEIKEMYRRITAAKLKKKQLSKKVRKQAWKILKDRESWQKHLDTLPSGVIT